MIVLHASNGKKKKKILNGEWGVGSGEWGVGSGEWGVGSGDAEGDTVGIGNR